MFSLWFYLTEMEGGKGEEWNDYNLGRQKEKRTTDRQTDRYIENLFYSYSYLNSHISGNRLQC